MIMAMDAGVQAAVVTSVGTVAAAGLGVVGVMRRQSRALGEVRENAREAREQVTNSHKTNLRDDLDRVINALELVLEGQRRHDSELSQLRSDLGQERRERLELEVRVDSRNTD